MKVKYKLIKCPNGAGIWDTHYWRQHVTAVTLRFTELCFCFFVFLLSSVHRPAQDPSGPDPEAEPVQRFEPRPTESSERLYSSRSGQWQVQYRKVTVQTEHRSVGETRFSGFRGQ